ncbi:unnamed protein product [marine sediment metagenome]|uniref:Uncharacterized protein n=1 Tax=marine sediment metagenome TaxID=412755 RepID=X1S4Q5_9ZZZZ
MGLIYKIYCPVCHWLLPPGAWQKLELKLRGKEDLPLGLMQKSDGRTFSRGNNLVNPSDIPASFPVVKERLMSAFQLWVIKEWIEDRDLQVMYDWIKARARIVRGMLLPRRVSFIEAKRGQAKLREL